MKIRYKKGFLFGILLLVLLVFIGFIEKKSAERKLSGIEVHVKAVSDVYFVDEKDILNALKGEFPLLQPGIAFTEINLHDIEKKVESHPFVKNAEVFGDQKGNLKVEIEQHVPLARISRPKAADGYISKEGLILPTSNHYTSRVLILYGNYAEKILEMKNLEKGYPELMDLIRYISEDPFWSAQITELEIPKKGDIRMYQQVGKQVIEFGEAVDIEEKFKKINLFYEEILPKKGWNTYSRVNIKYKGQIVCE
ncbi:cell division protein [Cecembia sp.]|uniref:cell division protein FtsQ/DivIB n=1 Tax=Cecembia sp. TaxID=1898110 RepID=UPI0025C58292|nr:cell division protein [Cecembia sp.]